MFAAKCLHPIKVKLNNCSLTWGNARIGAGVSLWGNASVDINDTYIAYNSAVDRAGGLAVTEDSKARLNFSWIANNTAGNRAGGLLVDDNVEVRLDTDCICALVVAVCQYVCESTQTHSLF
jgi:hypothetical protein